MSRFYADITGGRGTATRQGHAATGMRGHVRGWDSGVKVIARAEDVPELDKTVDVFDIWSTGGSNGSAHVQLIGHVRLFDNVPTFYPPPV